MRKKDKSPAFQFYPGDWLRSLRVTMMTHEEQGIYIRLLCHCWLNGSIPEDTKQLRALVGGRCKTKSIEKVKEMFQKSESTGNTMHHNRLIEEKIKQEQYNEKQRDRINKRWGKEYRGITAVLPDGYSSSSSSISTAVPGQYTPPKEEN